MIALLELVRLESMMNIVTVGAVGTSVPLCCHVLCFGYTIHSVQLYFRLLISGGALSLRLEKDNGKC